MGGKECNPLVTFANQIGESCKRFGQNVDLYDEDGNEVNKRIDEDTMKSWNDILDQTKQDALRSEVGITEELIQIVEQFDLQKLQSYENSEATNERSLNHEGKKFDDRFASLCKTFLFLSSLFHFQRN